MENYRGITSKEASEKLKLFGRNEIQEKKNSLIKKIFSWIFSFISLMLIAAAVISYIDGRLLDFYFIFFLWVVNFFIGFWHDKKTDDAIKKLQSKLSIIVDVFRDGAWKKISSTEIVPDDVLSLTAGKIIPADVKFIELKNITINESALTGESLPKEKKEGDMAYSGSFVATGIAVAQVIATGKSTYFGKTLLSVETSSKKSILEKDIIGIAKLLGFISVSVVIVMTAVFFIFHQKITEILALDLSLIIAGIPVSLPTVMTLIISLGVLKLAHKQAIVRKLSSLEDLSDVDLLLSDKTGTLTKNELSVSEIIPYGNFSTNQVIEFAYFATSKIEKGPIDLAIIKKFESENISQSAKILDFVPADSERKRTTSIVNIDNSTFAVSMGAVQIIQQFSKINKNDLESFYKDVKVAADGGYRVLAVSVSKNKEERDMDLAGIILISDRPEPDAFDTIGFLQKNHVAVKILTGDNIAISERIAKDMGLNGPVVNRSAIENINDNNFDENIFEKISVFSEILPSDKYNLVRMGQKRHKVAVTGDGVNDIPAVKAADVGIAVSGAVDALKSAADIVLLSPGISVIKDAIIEARKIFYRLYTYALYRISESLRLIFSIALLGILYLQYPMNPIQILILAVLNDLPIISLAYDNVFAGSAPTKINIKERTILGSLYGAVGLLGSVIFVFIAKQFFGISWNLIQTLFFLKLSIGGHMLIYVAHTKEKWYKFLPSKEVIWATTITQLIATIFAVSGFFMSPIKLSWAIIVWIWAFIWMQISEMVKQAHIRK